MRSPKEEHIPIRSINSIEREITPSGKFNIRKISTVLSGKDMAQKLHRHDFFFLLALERGSGEHIIDFTSYKIGNRSIFFLRPGQVHQLNLKKGSSGYLIEFDNSFYSPTEKLAAHVFRKVSSRNHCKPEAKRSNKLFSILETIYQEFIEKQERFAEVIKANMDILFIELARQSQNPDIAGNGRDSYAEERLDQLWELLRAHIAGTKQVAEYADMLHLSTYQLNAITKSRLGKTCSEVINEYIILESRRHLLATSNSVNSIALQLGYEDVSYFIRFFKRNTGYSPEAYRQNFR
jgi:AraC family transcriptional regulator, transcriptional activator of pobA